MYELKYERKKINSHNKSFVPEPELTDFAALSESLINLT